MNTEFTIKNFRTFDAEGCTFSLAPITILTGCNSAGKSSMVKSLLLMDNFIKQMKQDIEKHGDCYPKKYRLGITNSSLRLGNFTSVINRESDEKLIHFSYKMKPLISAEPFNVEYVFQASNSDTLNDAWLSYIKVTNKENKVVYNITFDNTINISKCDWSLLKSIFYKYASYEAMHSLKEQIEIHLQIPEATGFSNDDIDRFNKCLNTIKKLGCTKQLSDDIIKDFNDFYVNGKQHIFRNISDYFGIEQILSHNLIHYLPVFDILVGVHKQDVRDVLSKDLKAWNEDMSAIISDFEKSEYDTFIDYVRAKEETEGLKSIDKDPHWNQFENGLRHAITNSLSLRYAAFDILDAKEVKTISFQDFGSYENMDSKDITKETIIDLETKRQEQRKNISFQFLIDTLWKYSMHVNENFRKKYSNDFNGLNGYEHPLFQIFSKFVQQLLMDLIVPPTNFIYIASSKAEAQRLYKIDSINTDTFERLLNEYLETRHNYVGKYEPDSFMKKWLRNFNIGHSLSVKNTADGLGVILLLHNSESDIDGHLLADEGYGITQLVSILLNIETTIMKSNPILSIPKERKFYGNADGELKEFYSQSTIAIEEPEIHLHPKYQSLLLDMFYDAYTNYNIHFIIETHSEYLVRRSQAMVAESKFENEQELNNKCPFKVYYIPKPQEGKPYDMKYLPTGGFINNFGEGFFDEASKLDMIVLRNECNLRRR